MLIVALLTSLKLRKSNTEAPTLMCLLEMSLHLEILYLKLIGFLTKKHVCILVAKCRFLTFNGLMLIPMTYLFTLLDI